MLDVLTIRKDFKMLNGKMMQNHPLIYLDNGATTLKPKQVIDAVVNYYENYGANAHRGDYDLSYYVDQEYEQTRKDVAKFLNADFEEIIYTSGASAGLNLVAKSFGDLILNEGDIIISSLVEHASCVLPWMKQAQNKKAKIEYFPLQEDGRVNMQAFKEMLNDKVKVICLAHVSNVLGYQIDVKEIARLAHEVGAYVVVDGAQSVPHIKIDVKDLDIDFLAFSAHKMLGPTGIGILYGKKALLNKMEPLFYGGDSNARFDSCGNVELKQAPYKFESGTQPIEAIFGLHAAIKYLENIGLENIHQYELELREYAVKQMEKMDHITIYNRHNDSGIITFNVKDVFAQDVASYFNANGIAIRSGQHCAKLLPEVLQTPATLRASIYFYNTKEEIDRFLEVCANATMENCLNIFF